MRKKDAVWFYGKHACRAALTNPKRRCYQAMVATDKQEKYQDIIRYCQQSTIQVDFVDHSAFKNISVSNNHQGIAIRVSLLPQISLKELEYERCGGSSVILILDHITDPQNFGNILRSAAAFDVSAVVVPKDNSAGENTAVAKVASGALDLLPIISVANINNAISYLKTMGYWCYGLDQNADMSISRADIAEKSVLILGSENAGIKRLTKGKCDLLMNIPINHCKMESLNVANAASIVLYEIYKNFNR
jgi:23S rRNA (guanosine2251-2'-O)-methyltransferase